MSGALFKLLATCLILLVLVCGGLSSAHAQVAKLRIADLNVAGDYDSQPLIGRIYYSRPLAQVELPTLLVGLMAYHGERVAFAEQLYQAMVPELEKLKAGHKQLVMESDSRDFSSQDPESRWSLDLSQNITKQAQLKACLSDRIRRWDSQNLLLVGYEKKRGKCYLTWVRPLRTAGVSSSITLLR